MAACLPSKKTICRGLATFPALLVLALLQLPVGAASKLKLAISGLFLPLFGLSSSTHEWLGHTRDGIVSRDELQRLVDTTLMVWPGR